MFRKILQFCITIYSYGWKRLQPFSCWKRYPSSSFFLELLLKFAMFCMTAQFMSTNNVFYIEYDLVQIHNWINFFHSRNILLYAFQMQFGIVLRYWLDRNHLFFIFWSWARNKPDNYNNCTFESKVQSGCCMLLLRVFKKSLLYMSFTNYTIKLSLRLNCARYDNFFIAIKCHILAHTWQKQSYTLFTENPKWLQYGNDQNLSVFLRTIIIILSSFGIFYLLYQCVIENCFHAIL